MFASFKRILTIAAITSLIAGVLLTFLQQVQVIPSILAAEKYEQAAAGHHGEAHDRDAAGAHEHADEKADWQPAEGLERNLYTTLANIVVALGYALLLGAIAFLRNAKLNWQSGLVWGLVGYVVFFLAPALGMPPELPGSHSGALEERQLWWLLTVLCTGAGFALIFFNARIVVKIAGALLLVLPHFGVPHAPVPESLVPAELIQSFIVATALTNAVFWLALGGFYGFLNKKLAG
uniref:Cobalt transporter subunit CbtA n=1 Tax=Candidatus Kentrum sp. MB TaxID=2138164 RepID=A0A451B715_9GAMM|nr:MAG: cobalt transporter subunit CbtA [Candidatus Kentron sp. MB]VFK28775.1 MAG: cobalt transporter subunit CbtA [Candidatus Kentron sp. MB]VFK74090.1 MAG: cobalt transporter subunit CbtA [Candidatus Kentron sp. MB]